MTGSRSWGDVFMQTEMVFLKGQQAVPLHFSQLIGQGASVYAQIIGKLLPVEGDGKPAASVTDGLKGQVGQQPPADGFGGGVENPPGERQVFLGGDGQKVSDQRAVVGEFYFK